MFKVFSINEMGSNKMMTINPLHMLDSLAVNQELAEVQTVKIQMDSILSQLQFTNCNLQR